MYPLPSGMTQLNCHPQQTLRLRSKRVQVSSSFDSFVFFYFESILPLLNRDVYLGLHLNMPYGFLSVIWFFCVQHNNGIWIWTFAIWIRTASLISETSVRLAVMICSSGFGMWQVCVKVCVRCITLMHLVYLEAFLGLLRPSPFFCLIPKKYC